MGKFLKLAADSGRLGEAAVVAYNLPVDLSLVLVVACIKNGRLVPSTNSAMRFACLKRRLNMLEKGALWIRSTTTATGETKNAHPSRRLETSPGWI